MGESDFLEAELKYYFLINQGHCDKNAVFETSNLISLGPQLCLFLGRCDTLLFLKILVEILQYVIMGLNS